MPGGSGTTSSPAPSRGAGPVATSSRSSWRKRSRTATRPAPAVSRGAPSSPSSRRSTTSTSPGSRPCAWRFSAPRSRPTSHRGPQSHPHRQTEPREDPSHHRARVPRHPEWLRPPLRDRRGTHRYAIRRLPAWAARRGAHRLHAPSGAVVEGAGDHAVLRLDSMVLTCRPFGLVPRALEALRPERIGLRALPLNLLAHPQAHYEWGRFPLRAT